VYLARVQSLAAAVGVCYSAQSDAILIDVAGFGSVCIDIQVQSLAVAVGVCCAAQSDAIVIDITRFCSVCIDIQIPKSHHSHGHYVLIWFCSNLIACILPHLIVLK